MFFFAIVLAACWIGAGPKRGIALTALSVVVAALVIAPWTIRNQRVAHACVPLSVQDASIGDTFNPTAANDPVYPCARGS